MDSKKRKPDNDQELPKKILALDDDDDDDGFDGDSAINFTDAKEVGEIGIVKRIILRDFMCHSLLDVSFGNQINFITGKNGSGKSAIMTGLIVCFGGRNHGRGNNVRDLIKNGQTRATVTVYLKNEGSDAFRHNVYGDTIIVERQLNKEGGSAYTIKSGAGKKIESTREEVTHICDAFNIQVDNPICMLNQDTSKTFLRSSKEEDKYKFFCKATQLEELNESYVKFQQEVLLFDSSIHQIKNGLPEMENDLKIIEAKFKEAQKLKEKEESLADMKKELYWARIISLEDKEKGFTTVVKKLQKDDKDLITKLEQNSASMTEIAAQDHGNSEQLKEISAKEKALLAELKLLNEDYNKAKKLVTVASRDVSDKQKEITGKEMENKALKAELTKLKRTSLKDPDGGKAKREADITKKETELQQILAQIQQKKISQQFTSRAYGGAR